MLVLVEQPASQGRKISLKEPEVKPKESEVSPARVQGGQSITSTGMLPITTSMYNRQQVKPVLEQPLQFGTATATRQKIEINTQGYTPNIQAYKRELIQDTTVKQEYVQGSRQNTYTKTLVKQDTIQEQAQASIQDVVQQTKVEQKRFIDTGIKYTIVPEVVTPPMPPQERPTFKQQIFTAKAKVKGQFITLGTFGTMNEAFNRGKQFVQNTSSATFKVESGGTSIRQGLLPKGFTQSKSVVGGIVQERSQRISSQGEKIEISAKGRSVQRARFGIKKRRGIF